MIAHTRLAHHLRRAPLLTAVGLVLLAIAAAACGDDEAVRIVALTRTPGPTSTTPLVDVEEPAEPSPTPTATAELPARPERPLAGGVAVAGYLAGGGADLAGCLPALVEEWGLERIDGTRCLQADIDGDQRDEFIFLITLPSGAGDVWFFEGADEQYRLGSSARVLANDLLETVRIIAAEDLTGDGQVDPVITAQRCEASTCLTRFLIASAHRGVLEDLSPDDLLVPGVESAAVTDRTDDGLPDLVVRGGTVSSAGAGPQRAAARVISWGGLRFFDREQPDPPVFLFHAIVDADRLYAASDYSAARGAYLRAAADSALRDWKAEAGQPPGRAELASYAVLRAAVAALKDGDSAGGLALLRTAAADAGRTLHARAAATYEVAIGGGSAPPEACAAAEAVLDGARAEFARIWDYGFANPEHAISEVCR